MTDTSAFPLMAGSEGLWRQVLKTTASSLSPRAALFLDRDGVIVEEVNYLHRVADIRMLPGATDFIRHCNKSGIPVVLVTNQSGVGRGYYGWAEFAEIQNDIYRRLDLAGARFDMVLACAYHNAAQPPFDIVNHEWRKPRPGMLLEASQALNIDLGQSWIVGDSASDMEAAKNAGLAGGIHVLSGHGQRDREKSLALADTGFEIIVEAGIETALRQLSRLGA